MSVARPRGSTASLVANGPVPASVMVFGESGFVDRGEVVAGPDAGELLLRRALADVGIEPATVRFTSAARPDVVASHRPGPSAAWLAPLVAEVCRVQPRVLVLLGSSAGRIMLGAGFARRRQRGCLLPAPSGFGLDGDPLVLVTAHPSTVQRSRHRAFDYAAMVRDLRSAACLFDTT